MTCAGVTFTISLIYEPIDNTRTGVSVILDRRRITDRKLILTDPGDISSFRNMSRRILGALLTTVSVGEFLTGEVRSAAETVNQRNKCSNLSLHPLNPADSLVENV